MFTELNRLRKLHVTGDVQSGVDVEQALHLDTKNFVANVPQQKRHSAQQHR
jgi:hypothetical protein